MQTPGLGGGLETSGLGSCFWTRAFGHAFRGSFFGFVLLVMLFVVRSLGSCFLVVLFVVRSLGSCFLVVLFVVRSSVRAFGRSSGSCFWRLVCVFFRCFKILRGVCGKVRGF